MLSSRYSLKPGRPGRLFNLNSKKAGAGLRSDWETRWEVFNPVHEVLGFKIDVASSEDNKKCDLYISEAQDAFKTPWLPSPFFLNFPWGTQYKKRTRKTPGHWIKRALDQVRQGAEGAILCPASVNASWFHLGASQARYLLFPLSRPKYFHPAQPGANSPNFESVWMMFLQEELSWPSMNKLARIGLLVHVN